MKKIKTLVVAQYNVYVEGLLSILEKENSIRNVGIVSSPQERLASLKASKASLIIAHVDLLNNKIIEEIKQINSDLKILAFGYKLDRKATVALVRAGVSGYINSSMSADNFIEAIYQINKGHLWIERSMLEDFVVEITQLDRVLENDVISKVEIFIKSFTPKEKEVFQCIIKGLSTQDVAQSLEVSEQSIKAHLTNMFKKLRVDNRIQLVMKFYDEVSNVSDLNALIQTAFEKDISAVNAV